MFRDDKEKLRKLYQSEDNSDKVFIPAKPKVSLNDQARIFRVCAYCRVSTDNDAQLSSFELQQAHYRQLVKDRPNWDLQHIYADGPAKIGLNQKRPTARGALV